MKTTEVNRSLIGKRCRCMFTGMIVTGTIVDIKDERNSTNVKVRYDEPHQWADQTYEDGWAWGRKRDEFGINFAKALAIANSKPLIPVDHIKGHIAACYLDKDENAPKPPFIALAASGGHTAIYRVDSYTDIVAIGSTRDDAIGESFDKIGRIIGIPYPAGAGFDALSREGFIEATGDEENFYSKYKKTEAYKNPEMTLPSPAVRDDSLDFSFSGLKTAAINLLHKYEQRETHLTRALFAARYTYEAVEAVAKKLSLALDRYPGYDLAVAGGVAANSHLRKRLRALTDEKRVKLFIPPLSLCGDNAAMIGAQGYYEYEIGNLADSSLNASALDSILNI